MNYTETFYGINYSAKRGEELLIKASAEDFYISCWDGILHLMNYDLCGRTAIFVNDCSFFQRNDRILIKVKPGTASYMKELQKVRKISKEEWDLHQIGKLW